MQGRMKASVANVLLPGSFGSPAGGINRLAVECVERILLSRKAAFFSPLTENNMRLGFCQGRFHSVRDFFIAQCILSASCMGRPGEAKLLVDQVFQGLAVKETAKVRADEIRGLVNPAG